MLFYSIRQQGLDMVEIKSEMEHYQPITPFQSFWQIQFQLHRNKFTGILLHSIW